MKEYLPYIFAFITAWIASIIFNSGLTISRLMLLIVFSFLALLTACGGSSNIERGLAEEVLIEEPEQFILPKVDPEDESFVEEMGAKTYGQYCKILENIYINFYPEVDGMDLIRLEDENGVFRCELMEPYYVMIDGAHCNNLLNVTGSCHDDGVVMLRDVFRLTGCAETIHYILYAYGVNPSCRGLSSEDKDICEHGFDLFQIQRSDDWGLVCEGAEWMFAFGR